MNTLILTPILDLILKPFSNVNRLEHERYAKMFYSSLKYKLRASLTQEFDVFQEQIALSFPEFQPSQEASEAMDKKVTSEFSCDALDVA